MWPLARSESEREYRPASINEEKLRRDQAFPDLSTLRSYNLDASARSGRTGMDHTSDQPGTRQRGRRGHRGMADLLQNQGIHQPRGPSGSPSLISKPDPLWLQLTSQQPRLNRHAEATAANATQDTILPGRTLRIPRNKEMMIQKGMLSTSGPHTSKVKVSSDQPWQMGICSTHYGFDDVDSRNGTRAKLCSLPILLLRHSV